MSTEVVYEANLLSKSYVADMTGIRSLPRMDTLMMSEAGKLGKCCAADTTAERTLASMRTLMTVNSTFFARLVRAEPAPM